VLVSAVMLRKLAPDLPVVALVLGLVHEGRLALGIGEDPVVTSGDQLLIAEPVTGRRAGG
jgi:hypothetical protein